MVPRPLKRVHLRRYSCKLAESSNHGRKPRYSSDFPFIRSYNRYIRVKPPNIMLSPLSSLTELLRHKIMTEKSLRRYILFFANQKPSAAARRTLTPPLSDIRVSAQQSSDCPLLDSTFLRDFVFTFLMRVVSLPPVGESFAQVSLGEKPRFKGRKALFLRLGGILAYNSAEHILGQLLNQGRWTRR